MYYINGSYLKDEEANISPLDLGLIRGYGVFDYLRTYHGRPFHLNEHLSRLYYSAEQIGLVIPQMYTEIREIIECLLEKTAYPESSIKIIATGGVSHDQLMPHSTPSLIIHVYPHKPYPSSWYHEGIKAITTSLLRSIPLSKTIQYIPAIIALQQAQLKNAQEALYLNSKREILESTTSNFFAFKEDVLLTPPQDEILLGITREIVLKLASPHFKIEVRPLLYEEVKSCSETFITASNKEVMPLVQIDDILIGKGNVGKNTLRLMKLFADYTQSSAWPELNIARYPAESLA